MGEDSCNLQSAICMVIPPSLLFIWGTVQVSSSSVVVVAGEMVGCFPGCGR